MTTFATELSKRLHGNSDFWKEYREIRALGASKSLNAGPGIGSEGVMPLERLMFSASVFAQSEDESDLALAQSIALSSLFISSEPAVFESATTILAKVGNFPGVSFARSHFSHSNSPSISELQLHLLEVANTVETFASKRALTDFQVDVWAALPKAKTASISAPTSAGKSFVVMEYLCKSIAENTEYSAVYIAPTRALLGEVHKKLASKLAGIEGLHISTVPSIDPESKPRQLYILTQERLSALLTVSTLRPDIVVTDEAQNIADGARGMILQDCLERVRGRNPGAKLLFLSPGATGFSEALETIGIDPPVVKETRLSPVLQNRIVVSAVPGQPHKLTLSLLEKDVQTPLGDFVTRRGAASADARLAVVALELGAAGAALVYATGPADAEKVATRLVHGLQKNESSELLELSSFIKNHIHGEYGLAEMVLYGVAFHYGKMPNLLREAIEKAFQDGHIRFLVCTTTLFQGVNLPARNVFINTPTRGSGVALDPALLWNFAGRAGRLSRDAVGNVFLVDYNSWKEQPLDHQVNLKVVPSLAKTVTEYSSELIAALGGEMPKDRRADDMPAQVRAAAGYLIARSNKGDVDALLGRILEGDSARSEVVLTAAKQASAKLSLPNSVLEGNWTIDAFGLARLRDKLDEKVVTGKIEDFVPCDPTDESAYRVYARIFNVIAREVFGWNANQLGSFVSTYALMWMRGVPYPVLISKWIKNRKGKGAKGTVDSLIRGAFDFIEDELRFKWVQHGKAYLDVLEDVLARGDKLSLKSAVYDFSLALELGVSTKTAKSLIEIGLSRIAAAAVASLYPDSEMTAGEARSALKSLNVRIAGLSPVITQELLGLELISDA